VANWASQFGGPVAGQRGLTSSPLFLNKNKNKE